MLSGKIQTIMNIYVLILLATLGSVVSLTGGILLLVNKKLASKLAKFSGSFAAGALIAAVFLDLLPEALSYTDKSASSVLTWSLVGIAGFFILERRLRWFHHHHDHGTSGDKALPTMLIIGDMIHNAIDGVVIAFAYLADPAVGVVTTIAVAFHEIPQEIGDFGLLLKSGWGRKKIILANIFSALATVVAAITVFFIGRNHEELVAPAMAVSAGMLLYIALSDVLPSVHEKHPSRKWLDSANILFLSGMAVVYLAIFIAHQIEG